MPAAVRWISAEPLLGPIDLRAIMPPPPKLPAGISEVDGIATIDALNGLKLSTLGFEYNHARLDWVVAGGESGQRARPMHPTWARSLRDQCTAAGVAFHFKQWGEWLPAEVDLPGDGARYAVAEDGTEREIVGRATLGCSGEQEMLRVGKKRAGRVLDGRTHDDYPAAAP